jgi:hypothetical protein
MAARLSYHAEFGVGVDSTKTNQDPSIQSMPRAPKLNRYQIKEKEHVDALYVVTLGYPVFLIDPDNELNIGTMFGLLKQQDLAHIKGENSWIDLTQNLHHSLLSDSSYFFLAQATWRTHLDKNWSLSVAPELGIAQNMVSDKETSLTHIEWVLFETNTTHSTRELAFGAGITLKRQFKQHLIIAFSLRYLNIGHINQGAHHVAPHTLLRPNTLETEMFTLHILL